MDYDTECSCFFPLRGETKAILLKPKAKIEPGGSGGRPENFPQSASKTLEEARLFGCSTDICRIWLYRS